MEKENSNSQKKHNHKSIAKTTLKVLFIIFALKIALSLIATPKIKTDYILAYNDFSKPSNYQPQQNAWNDYQGAISLYLDINSYIENYTQLTYPEIIDMRNEINANNISPKIKNNLTKWLSLNSKAIDLAMLGASKPYFWYEYQTSKCMLRCIKKPYDCELAHLNNLLLYKARLESINKNFNSATKSLLSAYRIGMHLTKDDRFIRDQITGLNCKERTAICAMAIIESEDITYKQLEHLQNSLTKAFDNDSYIPSTRVENLLFDETLEWLFLDWKWGFNSISFRSLYHWGCPSETHKYSWVHSFVGPTQTQVSKQEKRLEYLHDKLRNTTLWQRQNEFAKDVKEIHDILESNIYWREFGYDSLLLYDIYQETKMRLSNLVTAIAIKRFKIDNNRFSRDLDELVSQKYIKQIPQDPYSGSSILYSHTKTEFKLYSVKDKTVTGDSSKLNRDNQ